MALFRRGKSAARDVPDSDVRPAGVDQADVGQPGVGETGGEHAGGEDAGRTPGGPGAAGAQTEAATTASGTDRTDGPLDSHEVESRGDRLDLGAIWLPRVKDMELRMEVDRRTQRITGVAVGLASSALQVQAFAAPRTMGIWDEIRAEITDSVKQQGGTADDLPGPFGRELLVQLPVPGATGTRPVRFIGVDGPRWFLRGVLTGKAATDPQAAATLESLFRGIVVVRDDNPRPPRDLLAIHLPGQVVAAQVNQIDSAGPAPDFDPLTRGPEITEIR